MRTCIGTICDRGPSPFFVQLPYSCFLTVGFVWNADCEYFFEFYCWVVLTIRCVGSEMFQFSLQTHHLWAYFLCLLVPRCVSWKATEIGWTLGLSVRQWFRAQAYCFVKWTCCLRLFFWASEPVACSVLMMFSMCFCVSFVVDGLSESAYFFLGLDSL